jgi:hypothetical protein
VANCNLQPNRKGLNLGLPWLSADGKLQPTTQQERVNPVPTLLSADGKLIFLFAHREENVLRECHSLIFTLSRKLFEMSDGFGGEKLRNVFLSLWPRSFFFGTTSFFKLEYFSRRGYKIIPKRLKWKNIFHVQDWLLKCFKVLFRSRFGRKVNFNQKFENSRTLPDSRMIYLQISEKRGLALAVSLWLVSG